MKDHLKLITNRHCILFSILVCIITLLISSLFSWDEQAVMGYDKLLADVLISIFCFTLICLLDLRPTIGLHSEGFAKGLKLGIPFIIIGILGAVIGNLGTNLLELSPRSFGFILLFTLNMVMVGVNEEILMRGLILNHLVRQKGTGKAIILSAVVFGAIHLPNMFFFDPITVLVQSINAASAGVLFAMIYLISKNLWSVILIHMLVDWLSLFIGQCFINGASVISVSLTPWQAVIMILLGSTPPLTIAWIYYRFQKRLQ